MLDGLRDHFIVCGYGRIGSIIVDEFRRQHVPHVIVERNPQRIQQLLESGHLALEGDASSEDVLTRAGIQKARGLIAAVSTDAENVYTILSARLMNPSLYVIGRAESDESARKLRQAGADRVMSPYQIGGLHMAGPGSSAAASASSTNGRRRFTAIGLYASLCARRRSRCRTTS